MQMPDDSELLHQFTKTLQQSPKKTVVPEQRTLSRAQAKDSLRLAAEAGEERLRLSDATLGEGGMSTVVAGHQLSLDRPVAIKVPRSKRHAPDLIGEAWVTAFVEHPNVVPIYDITVDADGMPQVALKRIEGRSWAELLGSPETIAEDFGAEDPLLWHLQLLIQVCNAIHFAHSRGIVHRDLKPENIMVGTFGEVYVLDWGIAVSIDSEGSAATARAPGQSSSIAGTPVYMAPEMFQGEPVDERTDVYLLGACLYETLMGTAPHDAPTIVEIAHRSLHSSPSFSPELDPDLVDICRSALAPAREDRPATAEALRRQLVVYLERRSARHLAKQATEDLERLREAAQSDEDVPELYNLYGACRFGFDAALRSWAQDPDAHQGLRDALGIMVSVELRRGQPNAARSLLQQFGDGAPAELRTAVDNALAEQRSRQRQVANLKAVAAKYDPRQGRAGRFFVVSLLGAIWAVVPLLRQWVMGPHGDTHSVAMAAPAAYVATLLAAVFVQREALLVNRYNRRIVKSAMAILGSMFIVASLNWHWGGAPAQSMLLSQLVLAVSFLMWSTLVHPPLVIGAITFFTSFFVGTEWPELRLYASSVANAITFGTFAWIWRPRGDTEDEETLLEDESAPQDR